MAEGTGNIGEIQMTAAIDVGPLQQGVKAIEDTLKQLDPALKNAQKGLTAMEQSGKVTAGSILDLKTKAQSFREELEALSPQTQQFVAKAEQMNETLKKLATAQKLAGDATDKTTFSSRAMSMALGIAGVQSVEAIVRSMIAFGKEALQLSIQLDGIRNRGTAIFGDAFPKMTAAIDTMSGSLRRSSSDLMEFATGFGAIYDSVGISNETVQKYSKSLTELTVVLGKAFPDRSDVEIFQTLTSAIEGNARGLRGLGIIMTDKALQDLADRNGIKLKIKDMDDDQKTMIRSMFLIQETTKLQEAGAVATGDLGDSAKEASGKFKDLQETAGQAMGPVFVSGIATAIEMLQGLVTMLQIAQGAASSFFSMAQNAVAMLADPGKIGMFGDNTFTDQTRALDKGLALNNQNSAALAAAAQRRQATGSGKMQSSSELAAAEAKNFWAKHPGIGGGGSETNDEDKALAEAKKLYDDIRRIQSDILKSESDLASKNKERMTSLRDQLIFKQKSGALTATEKTELDRINERLEFQKEKIKDLVSGYEDAVTAVKKIKDEITNINEQMVKDKKAYDDQNKKIDEDAMKEKAEKIADLLKQQSELEAKLARSEGLSGSEKVTYEENKTMLDKAKGSGAGVLSDDEIKSIKNQIQQLQEYAKGSSLSQGQQMQLTRLQGQLTTSGDPTGDAAAYNLGTKLNAADDFGKIDIRTGLKKGDLKTEYEATLTENTEKLTQAKKELAKAEAAEVVQHTRVIAAMDAMQIKTQTSYDAAAIAVTTSVATQVGQMTILMGQLDALAARYDKVAASIANMNASGGISSKAPPQKFATGGLITGPGTGTSDSIIAAVSTGEFIINAEATSRHRQLIEAINSNRLSLPRFATGGVVGAPNVSTTNNRPFSLTQNFHGDAAKSMQRPDQLRWHGRIANR